MKIRRAFLTLTVFWALFAHYALLAGDKELLRLWSAPGASVRERAAAVNRSFTNGTPITVVVAVLGTNFTTFQKSYSEVWIGPGDGPEPGENLGMIYRFGDGEVLIWTKHPKNPDPLTGNFSSAVGICITSKIGTGQPGGPANGSQPFRSETNGTSPAVGSRR